MASGIEVIARSYLDSVMIRWAPASSEMWQYGNQYGYVIERSLIARDTSFFLNSPPRTLLTLKPVKPLPLKQWEPLAAENSYAAIAAQAIYGSSFEIVSQQQPVMRLVNQARELENRFSFALFAADQSAAAARAHGLLWVDHTVRKNERYLYRIYIPVPDTSLTAAGGFVYIASQDTAAVPKPQQLEVQFGDKVAELSWNKQYFDRIFTSYLLEKTDDPDRGFQQVAQPPIVNLTHAPRQQQRRMQVTDSIADNETTYYYRIRGITPFGEISPPSDTVSGKGIPGRLPLSPVIIRHEWLPVSHPRITWEFPEDLSGQIQGFAILRSAQAAGIYDTLTTTLLPAPARQFVDPQPLPVGYYVVQTVDRQGRKNSSMPSLVQMEDSIPPLPPVGLSGQIDTVGKVKLWWENNAEEDLQGYRLLMANNPAGPYVQVSDSLILTNSYTSYTTLHTLSRYLYYRVVAVDKRYNRSLPSETLRLQRPDRIPPVAPVFQQVIAADSSIQLFWIPSSSSDVAQQLLYRRKVFHNQWQLQTSFTGTPTVSSFTDRSVAPGEEYEYRLIAVDSSGQESPPSAGMTVSTLPQGMRKAVQQFYGRADRTAKQIQLAWNEDDPHIRRFLLYRTTDSQLLRLLTSLPGNIHSYVEKDLTVNTVYTYRIQAVYADGSQSALSEALSVQY